MSSPVLLCPVCTESVGISGVFSCHYQEAQSWGSPELQWSWNPTQTLCGWVFCSCQHTEKRAHRRVSPLVSMISWELCNCRREVTLVSVECNLAAWEPPSWEAQNTRLQFNLEIKTTTFFNITDGHAEYSSYNCDSSNSPNNTLSENYIFLIPGEYSLQKMICIKYTNANSKKIIILVLNLFQLSHDCTVERESLYFFKMGIITENFMALAPNASIFCSPLKCLCFLISWSVSAVSILANASWHES